MNLGVCDNETYIVDAKPKDLINTVNDLDFSHKLYRNVFLKISLYWHTQIPSVIMMLFTKPNGKPLFNGKTTHPYIGLSFFNIIKSY